MKKFNFRLEPVLKQRENREQEAIMAQARARQQYMDCLKEYEETCRELEEYMEVQGRDCFDAVNSIMYREFLMSKTEEKEKELAEASKKLEECMQKTVEARKKKMVLENLKQHKYSEYIYEVKKEEQKLNDEIASQASIRQQM